MEDGRWEGELLTLLCGDGLAGANGGNVKLSFLAHAAFSNLCLLSLFDIRLLHQPQMDK